MASAERAEGTGTPGRVSVECATFMQWKAQRLTLFRLTGRHEGRFRGHLLMPCTRLRLAAGALRGGKPRGQPQAPRAAWGHLATATAGKAWDRPCRSAQVMWASGQAPVQHAACYR